MKKKVVYCCVILFFVFGIFLGIFINQNFLSTATPSAEAINLTPKHCPYDYVNPSRCEPDVVQKKKEYTSLRNDLASSIEMEKKDGSATDIAIYFRDLQNGPSVNINGQMDFKPASLLKVPLMITYLRKAEDDPSILKKSIIVSGDFQLLPVQEIKPQKSAIPGKKYTRDELITMMITQSDNYSWIALLTDLQNNYSEDDFIATLSDLGIIDPRISVSGQYLSVQTYASIFRILYNSSYLNTPMSDRALKLLTQATYNDGIVAGLPKGIKVAHKFGETNTDGVQELHDCGIVYYPPDPYILCIMTKGHDIPTLEQVIQQISQEVYQAVQNRN